MAGLGLHEGGGSTASLGSRLLRAVQSRSSSMDDILKDLQVLPGSGAQRLLGFMAEHQLVLRGGYTPTVGRICLDALRILFEKQKSWSYEDGVNALRVLEGILMACQGMDSEVDRVKLTSFLWLFQRQRGAPRQVRVECALLSMTGPELRRFLWPDRLPVLSLDSQLAEMVAASRPTKEQEEAMEKAFKSLNAVLVELFGTEGKLFGSAVNGFQMSASDLDVMVLMSTELQEKLVVESRIMDLDPSLLGNMLRAASVAAAKKLGESLEGNDRFEVLEVVDSARVPIVKCRSIFGDGLKGPEMDVSFFNEVAYYNSRLLHAYADFDRRAMSLGVLVKLWAKRRKINSPFQNGTLSSYSYTLMVVHYLQRLNLLPNLQRPRQEVLDALGNPSMEHYLEAGHNIWFVDPKETPPEVQGRGPEFWLGSPVPSTSLSALLYGFYRYFAVEFNPYTTVVSIRMPSDVSKLDYFTEMVKQEDHTRDVHPRFSPAEEAIAHQDALQASPVEHQVFPGGINAGNFQTVVEDSDSEQGSRSPPESPSFEPSPGATPAQSSLEALLMEADCEELPRPMTPSPEASVDGSRPRESSALDALESDTFGEADGGTAVVDVSPAASVRAGLEEATDGAASFRGSEEAGRRSNEASPPVAADKDRELGFGSLPVSKIFSPKERQIGKVNTYNQENGFGFIKCDATHSHYNRDVFLHAQQKQEAGVEAGDMVSFVVQENQRGEPQAREVQKLESSDLMMASKSVGPVGSLRASQPPPESDQMRASRKFQMKPCLCIDDPVEKLRTLGTSYKGQEILALELRRALSIMKKGASDIEKLFQEKEQPAQRERPQREFSPMPDVWNRNSKKNQFMITHDVTLDATRLALLKQSKQKWAQELTSKQMKHTLFDSPPRLELKGNIENIQRAVEIVHQNCKPRPPVGELTLLDPSGPSGPNTRSPAAGQGGAQPFFLSTTPPHSTPQGMRPDGVSPTVLDYGAGPQMGATFSGPSGSSPPASASGVLGAAGQRSGSPLAPGPVLPGPVPPGPVHPHAGARTIEDRPQDLLLSAQAQAQAQAQQAAGRTSGQSLLSLINSKSNAAVGNVAAAAAAAAPPTAPAASAVPKPGDAVLQPDLVQPAQRQFNPDVLMMRKGSAKSRKVLEGIRELLAPPPPAALESQAALGLDDPAGTGKKRNKISATYG